MRSILQKFVINRIVWIENLSGLLLIIVFAGIVTMIVWPFWQTQCSPKDGLMLWR